MNAFANALLIAWERNRDYGAKLVADLTDEQMIAMPLMANNADQANVPGMNHPTWILSHLNAYHTPLIAMLTGATFDDPKDHPFGMLSKPQADASVYPGKDELVAAWEQGHADVAMALTAASDDAFARPMTLERWQKVFPCVIDALPYVMISHEATHLGQLSAWRRVQGLASV